MPTASLVSGLIEHSINYWLQQSGCDKQVPGKLAGKQFVLQITDLSIALQMHIQHNGKVSVWSPVSEDADCSIITSLSGLIKLQQPEQITRLIKAGEVDIEGDVQLAQAYADWLKGSLIYWQDVLASLTSGPVAHKLTDITQNLNAQGQLFKQNSERAFCNIVWDEKKLAPHPLEMAEFNQAVKTLRQDCDRAQARIQQLNLHFKPQVENKQ
ncbi:ubiquinone biosynthesis accessory factor UbiJ [Catenovulum sediminis]|uniref:SCP2 sterol-binding domain-containing protein n=1 Tax=Catenovulum sediminis TaxID=1740262 RepID=A0ABV1RIW0_9ALTE